jgi:CRISPR-associated protein Cmr1
MNGHLPLDKLREEEAKIFGGTGDKEGKSDVIIRISGAEIINQIQISLTPHHRDGYCKSSNRNCFFRRNKCMKANKSEGTFFVFEVNLLTKQHSQLAQDLFEIVSCLGGLGKRSRRGFGSFQVKDKPVSIQYLLKKMNNISQNSFGLVNSNKIRNINPSLTHDIPFIKEVELGKTYSSYKDILIAIGEASHDFNKQDGQLGFARGSNRLASPIYASVIKFSDRDYRPIVTTLNTVLPNSNSIANYANQMNFKDAIL